MSKKLKDGVSSRLVRCVAAPVAGIAFAAWSVSVLTGIGSMGTTLAASSRGLPLGMVATEKLIFNAPIRVATKNSDQRSQRLAVAQPAKSGRLLAEAAVPVQNAVASLDARFEKVVTQAALSHDKLAALFTKSGPKDAAKDAAAAAQVAIMSALPSSERFGRMVAEVAEVTPLADRFGSKIEKSFDMALATIDPTAVRSLDMLVSPLSQPAVAQPEMGENLGESAALPNLKTGPDGVPLPSRRPKVSAPRSAPQVAAVRPDRVPPANSRPSSLRSERGSPAVAQPSAIRSERGTGTLLAYARADEPDASVSQAFKNLFTAPGRGSGVAVYDISARTVTMPDGSKLEAHSGIGAMADNPRYVDRKMNGPTPINTYNLVMRESRFYGVEAIRLLPVDGKNKHGRTGLLAHSYLLRGGRAESHGCVAFKDYSRFLAAFKKGKIKRLVVVS